MATFVKEREWSKFHTPRNVLLALVGEVGEVAEHFQWKGEVEHNLLTWTDEEKLGLSEELADVQLYLVRLSNLCGIDLSSACLRKMDLNRKKYPVEKCKGSAAKYTAYVDTENTSTTKSTATTTTSSASSSALPFDSSLSSASSTLIMGTILGIILSIGTSYVLKARS